MDNHEDMHIEGDIEKVNKFIAWIRQLIEKFVAFIKGLGFKMPEPKSHS